MERPVLSSNGEKLVNFLGKKAMLGDFTNDDLVQFIECAGDFLNLKTITDYAKANNMSYNGVKNGRKTIEIFKIKFVIHNK